MIFEKVNVGRTDDDGLKVMTKARIAFGKVSKKWFKIVKKYRLFRVLQDSGTLKENREPGRIRIYWKLVNICQINDNYPEANPKNHHRTLHKCRNIFKAVTPRTQVVYLKPPWLNVHK